MDSQSVRQPNRRSLFEQLDRKIRRLIKGRQFEPVEQLPNAIVMTKKMLRSHAWCKPLNAPDWRGDGDFGHMRPDDPVLGVCRNGKAWALPWWIMKNHHVANVVLDGEPILITLCELCSSASAFRSNLNGGF